MLELRNVSFQVSEDSTDKEILKNVSFTLEDNKFVAITGPNGGGKSTLARMIAGIIKPVSGSILLDGQDITNLSVTELARGTKISVFDEPEAGIDLWSFQNLIQVFEKMHDQKHGSILIISHQERILKTADEILVIADGEVAGFGSRDEILPSLLNSDNAESGCKFWQKEGA